MRGIHLLIFSTLALIALFSARSVSAAASSDLIIDAEFEDDFLPIAAAENPNFDSSSSEEEVEDLEEGDGDTESIDAANELTEKILEQSGIPCPNTNKANSNNKEVDKVHVAPFTSEQSEAMRKSLRFLNCNLPPPSTNVVGHAVGLVQDYLRLCGGKRGKYVNLVKNPLIKRVGRDAMDQKEMKKAEEQAEELAKDGGETGKEEVLPDGEFKLPRSKNYYDEVSRADRKRNSLRDDDAAFAGRNVDEKLSEAKKEVNDQKQVEQQMEKTQETDVPVAEEKLKEKTRVQNARQRSEFAKEEQRMERSREEEEGKGEKENNNNNVNQRKYNNNIINKNGVEYRRHETAGVPTMFTLMSLDSFADEGDYDDDSLDE